MAQRRLWGGESSEVLVHYGFCVGAVTHGGTRQSGIVVVACSGGARSG